MNATNWTAWKTGILVALMATFVIVLFWRFAGTQTGLRAPRSPHSLSPALVVMGPEGASAPAAGVSGLPSSAELSMRRYIEIMDSCDWSYQGACVNLRAGPGTEYTVLARLRTGIVLEVEPGLVTSDDGMHWYKIVQDTGLQYPERVIGDWYVMADPAFVRPFADPGPIVLEDDTPATDKRIVVDVASQTLSAYDGDRLYMTAPVSTGLALTPTLRGTFTVFRKTPSRYMQGPLPGMGGDYYDLPGVPWDLYFTQGGAVIHGAYWHENFGRPWSHGCVNLSLENAMRLYAWAEVGTEVTVR